MTAIRHRRRAARPSRGFSLLEAGLVIGVLGLVALWLLPRLTADQVVVGDRTAQTDVDLVVDAALAARRDLGTFTGDVTVLDAYVVDVPLVAADTTSLAPGQVSVDVAGSGTLAAVAAAAVTDDGVCWLIHRAFGTATFEVVHGYATAGPCNADAAATLVPDPAQPDRGGQWGRPLDVTP